MAFDELAEMASSYRRSGRRSLLEIGEQYRRRHEREVLELAAIAADVGIDDLTNLGLDPDENPLLREALEKQYPNISTDDLVGRSDENLEGIVNGLKGKYFEILVRERLEDGESVGGIVLGEGERALLAESANQAGWDLQIVDRSGEQVDLLQLKATESMSYVKEHLERYPDIKVVVPEDLSQFASEVPEVVSAEGMSLDDITGATAAQVQEWSESTLVAAVHHGAEYAFDSVPVVSIGVTMLIEGQRVLTGRSTVDEALRRGGAKIVEASIWTSAGAALTSVGVGEPISAVAIVGARAYAGRVSKYRNLADTLQGGTEEIRRLLQGDTVPNA